jgi:nucleoside-diphosphate-sugar epimerase
MKRYLVTGGAGFIGSALVRGLLERDHQVRVLDNYSTGHRANLNALSSDVEIVEGDIRSAETCARAMKGVTHVLHSAALPSVPRSIRDPQTTHDVNATGTLHVLIAARDAGVERFVYASSSSVYGRSPKLPREETDTPEPVSAYAVSKLCGEHYSQAFWHSYGLETVALRYFNVFGPRQRWDSPYAGVIPRFVRAFEIGERPVVFGDGEQTRDFTYIDNVVNANLLALHSKSAPGNVYNIGAGSTLSINELAASISAIMNKELDLTYEPPRPGDVRCSQADVARAVEDLGYEPNTGVAAGLPPTVEWLLANHG